MNRYVLFQIDTNGGNGLREILRDVEALLRTKYNYNANGVIVKGVDGGPLFEKQWEAFINAGIPEGCLDIRPVMKRNIIELLNKCKGATGFKLLDGLVEANRNQGYEALFGEDGLKVVLSLGGHKYYLKKAYMNREPYKGNPKVLEADGNIQTLYEYTFEFNPAKDSPNLNELVDTSDPNQYRSLVEAIKANFCSMGGWGLPCMRVQWVDTDLWIDQSTVLMKVEDSDNKVVVLGPDLNDYQSTLDSVYKSKLQWADSVPTSTPKPVKQSKAVFL